MHASSSDFDMDEAAGNMFSMEPLFNEFSRGGAGERFWGSGIYEVDDFVIYW